MNESTKSDQKDKTTTSSVHPPRQQRLQKQLVSIQHGATINEQRDEKGRDSEILHRRTAVVPIFNETKPSSQLAYESHFNHDFSTIPTQTIHDKTPSINKHGQEIFHQQLVNTGNERIQTKNEESNKSDPVKHAFRNFAGPLIHLGDMFTAIRKITGDITYKSYLGKTFTIIDDDARLRHENELSKCLRYTKENAPPGKKAGDYIKIPKGSDYLIDDVKKVGQFVKFIKIKNHGWTSVTNVAGRLIGETLGISAPQWESQDPAHKVIAVPNAPIFQKPEKRKPKKTGRKIPQGKRIIVKESSQPKGKFVLVARTKKVGGKWVEDTKKEGGWIRSKHLVGGWADYKGPYSKWERYTKKEERYTGQTALVEIVEEKFVERKDKKGKVIYEQKGKVHQLTSELVNPYNSLRAAAAEANINLKISSGFRDYPKQARLRKQWEKAMKTIKPIIDLGEKLKKLRKEINGLNKNLNQSRSKKGSDDVKIDEKEKKINVLEKKVKESKGQIAELKKTKKIKDAYKTLKAIRGPARPGRSQHQSGRAIDFANMNPGEEKDEYKWMQENASDYGFVRTVSTKNERHHWEFIPDKAKELKEKTKESKGSKKFFGTWTKKGNDKPYVERK